jgi:hypothetical protein
MEGILGFFASSLFYSCTNNAVLPAIDMTTPQVPALDKYSSIRASARGRVYGNGEFGEGKS